MENKFYTDDFEQFLKETADDFRMYPSKRVWNSLYNNLHPGRKWPSLAVSLLLVSSIIFIGLSHKNEITGSGNLVKNNKEGKMPLIASQQNVDPVLKQGSPIISDVKNATTAPIPNSSAYLAQAAASQSKTQVSPVIKNTGTTNQIATAVRNNSSNQNNHNQDLADALVSQSNNNTSTIQFKDAITEEENVRTENKISSLTKDNSAIANVFDPQKMSGLSIIENKLSPANLPLLATAKSKKKLEMEWIEDYAFHNQPAPSLKSKLVYELYVTPSIGYRTLKQTASYPTTSARPSSLATPVPDGHPALKQNAALNLELGYSVSYNYSKAVRIKAGVQFNYTSYKGEAHELGHYTSANLALVDPYSPNGVRLSSRSTHLGNLYGNGNEKKINNSTVQVSLPIGTDIKIAGKQHNLQWFVGATVQPTYVLFGNAYLVSADFKNYIYDSKFLRKWNINAGLEAFVSYRTKRGVTFNAGPQFRYQFLSTYKNKYSFDEKLYNVGIKFGIVKNF
ncbi:MAG: hypothetical protein QM737_05335 [Ferruginibacter sp.]